MSQTFLSWEVAPLTPLLQNYEVHIWCADLNIHNDLLQQLLNTLSHDEKERAARFVRDEDRLHFIAARSILRDILSRYCGCDSKDIQLAYNAKGKPSLGNDQSQLQIHFNLSHSNDIALYAISKMENIGIDIEYIKKDIHPLDIAERFFSKDEILLLSQLPTADQLIGFYKIWTRKEAYVKAIGEGISHPLDQFSVDLAIHKSKIKFDSASGLKSDWYIYNILLHHHYTAALALSNDDPFIHYWQWLKI